MTIEISVSGMDTFFTCPRKYQLSRKWVGLGINEALKNGGDAHAVVSGSKTPDQVSQTARAYAGTLMDMEAELGLEILKREFTQRVLLFEDVYLTRIIDAAAMWHGVGVLIDYKTASKGYWPKTPMGPDQELVAPKARGFQAVGYTWPPSEDSDEAWAPFGDSWPDTIGFLVGNTQGIHEIYWTQADGRLRGEFLSAARMMAWSIRNECYPAYRGTACGEPGSNWDCSMRGVCYEINGWQQAYRRKEDKKNVSAGEEEGR